MIWKTTEEDSVLHTKIHYTCMCTHIYVNMYTRKHAPTHIYICKKMFVGYKNFSTAVPAMNKTVYNVSKYCRSVSA